MICPECGKEINDNDIFCGYCGAEIINIDVPLQTDEKKGGRSPKIKSEDKKKKFKIAVRVIGAIIVIAVIIIIIIFASASIKSAQGRKIFGSVPLGRDIDIIESTTGTAFIGGESSSYGALNHIADYDYICGHPARYSS